MTVQMNDRYAGAPRAALIEHVEAATARHRRTGLRVVAGAGAGVLVLGRGVAAAAAAGWLSPLPGGDVVTTEAHPVTVTRTGTATVELGAVPEGATDVMLRLRRQGHLQGLVRGVVRPPGLGGGNASRRPAGGPVGDVR